MCQPDAMVWSTVSVFPVSRLARMRCLSPDPIRDASVPSMSAARLASLKLSVTTNKRGTPALTGVPCIIANAERYQSSLSSVSTISVTSLSAPGWITAATTSSAE